MQEQLNQLQNQIIQLQEQLDMLRSSASFPYDTEQAIIQRLNPVSFTPTTKTAASETVNVAGTDVALPMNGFELRVVDGQQRFFPYYTD